MAKKKAQDFGEWYKQNNVQDDEPPKNDPAKDLAYETAQRAYVQQISTPYRPSSNLYRSGNGLGIGTQGDVRSNRNIGQEYPSPGLWMGKNDGGLSPEYPMNPNISGGNGGGGNFGNWTPREVYDYANKMVDDGYWTYNHALGYIDNALNNPNSYYAEEHNGTLGGGGHFGNWTDDDLIDYLSKQISAGNMTLDDAKDFINRSYSKH